MCGLSGIFAINDNGTHWLDKIQPANDCLIHRGPDFHSTVLLGKAALGHCRLSIIDTSEAGNQPFVDSSGRYHMVLNGEIFNFKEIRNELLGLGYSFRSDSDTEVLLYAFIQFGKEVLNRLRGFFSFAIFDKQEDSIFIARDRFGVKPLYYYLNEDVLIFASEMKALIAAGIPREINPVALYRYFSLNYIPGSDSIYKGVKRMEPGTWMKVSSKGKECASYYTLADIHLQNNKPLNYQDACKQLEKALNEAVELRMISDVPLGAFLSGGIDSSIITALASKHTDHLKTFSIGFKDEPMFDETRYAKIIADKYKTDHTAFELSTDDMFDCLFDMLDCIDEPYADSSALAVFILSKYTRKEVTVALSGDGADEMFGGYNKHRAEYRMMHQGLLEKLVSLGSPLWGVLPQSRNNPLSNRFRQLNRFANAMKQSPADRYWSLCSISSANEVSQLLKYKDTGIVSDYISGLTNVFGYFDRMSSLEASLSADMNMVLPDDMLVKVDRMSMANALEVRNPFLDHKVVELAFSIPLDWKIDNYQQKKILKDSFKTLLPDEILNRRKHGFEVPLLKWFRGDLKDKIENHWLNPSFVESQNLFNPIYIQQLLKKVQSSNPGDSVAKVWALISFQNWWIKYHG